MDIVERFRKSADFSVGWGPPSDWLHEAADEIERLREALQAIVDIDYLGNPHQSANIARAALKVNE